MSGSDVTRDGIRGERPGREAHGGQGARTQRFGSDSRPASADGDRTGRRRDGRRRGRGGEELMVPKAEFTSYYGRPIVKAPSWEPLDIAGYFFLGGLAGAGSVLAAGAAQTGRTAMGRAMKVSSAVAIGASAVALVHDLGRPARFANMLRVLKPTSPMSIGSWLLSAYAPAAGAAALLDVTGRLPRLGRAATLGAAMLGPAIATYTAVLAADTAVPAWHDGYRELPFVFAGSATAAASGMALIAAPTAESGPARTGALLGAALEQSAMKALRRRLGVVEETYREGEAGRLLQAADMLTFAGAACGALLGGRSRIAGVLGGGALLAGSACTRFGIFKAGIQSAQDPKYTTLPQRQRSAPNTEPTEHEHE